LKIQFTRGRPYKKDDNAHIEQKNWTHVRKLIGWERFDTQKATDAINGLYGREWRLMMNLFQPSVKLMRKVRVGSRLTRKYDKPQAPLDRLLACAEGDAERLKNLKKLRESLDPFELACGIDRKLEKIDRLASRSAISVPMNQRKLENAPAHLEIGPPKPAKRKRPLSTSEKERKLRIA
jgi:hypothetical protein